MAIRIRRGLESDRLSVTPDAGEFLYTTDNKEVYIGDGVTAGGTLVGGAGSLFITSILDTANIDLDVTSSTLSADLTNTTVIPNTYGDANNIPQITVDQKGRVTSVTDIPITIPPNYIDSISDTSTIDLTVTGTTLSADFASMDISQFTNDVGYLSAVPNLQDVTDAGNSTTNDIDFGAGAGLTFNNGAQVQEGTTDAGLGGAKGVALVCSIAYELKWEAGRLYAMEQDGFTIRVVMFNFNVTPTVNDDNTKGFVVGSRWILDDGNVYECTDDTTGAAVWNLIIVGTVTSVGLSMPSAFNVANSPVTTSGTLTVTGAGLASQYIRGDGSLANFPSTSGGGASVSYYLNGGTNQGTFGGNTYYEMNKSAVVGSPANFSIAANGYIANFITDANDPSLLNIPSGNWNFEMYFNASSGGGSPSFYVELYKYDGTSFTLIASSTPENITNGTAIDLYTAALAVPQTTLAVTDRLAVRVYVNNSGRTITLHTQDSTLCQVITTFTTGITALNGLTEQVQNFATGTTGTDFGITSSVSTHTFNLPIASGTNTGKLSSGDWTTFNNKVTSIGAGTGISIGGTTTVPTVTNTAPDQTVSLTQGGTTTITGTYPNFTISSADQFTGTVTSVSALTLGTSGTDLNSTVANSTTTPVITLNVPTASATNRGVLSSTDWTTFNNKQNALTNPVTGTGTNNQIAYFNSTGSTIASLTTATYPSLTELSYVKGATSAIQTQLNTLSSSISPLYTRLRTEFEYFDDFEVGLAFPTSAFIKSWFSATAGFWQVINFSYTNANAVVIATTQSSSTASLSVGAYNPNAIMPLGNGETRFKTRVHIPTLSTGTERFTITCGFIWIGDTRYNIRFSYSDNINSGKWQLSCQNFTQSTLDSGITVNANTWYTLEFVVNAAGTSVEFFIDYVSVGTINTNIPTSLQFQVLNTVTKSVGTTNRTVAFDYIYANQKWTSNIR